MPNQETELHCGVIEYLMVKGIPEEEMSRVLLEAAINVMLSENVSHEDIIEAVTMILEEDEDGNSEG
jgi:deoxyxylulose-5-phosphate synthase